MRKKRGEYVKEKITEKVMEKVTAVELNVPSELNKSDI